MRFGLITFALHYIIFGFDPLTLILIRDNVYPSVWALNFTYCSLVDSAGISILPEHYMFLFP